ncbi:Fic family protein [Rudaeicoccus suwonensis]|nr:Fic family protein [Rudaeicoccus suwonensis]
MPDALQSLHDLPGVADAVTQAREACTALRWHNALRRRIPEVAAESRVRGARWTAALDGADYPVDIVRDVMRGALDLPDASAPMEQTLRGAVQVTAETESVAGVVRMSPAQALARLHTAAAAQWLDLDAVARPRRPGESAAELQVLGTAPDAEEAAARMRAVVDLIAGSTSAPGLLVGAIAHAEIATARPFVAGNGLVARALERSLITATGLDPTGSVVVEAGHGVRGVADYQGALAAYSTGTTDGVRLWLIHCAEAVVAGAGEAQRICDSVLAGRLGVRAD